MTEKFVSVLFFYVLFLSVIILMINIANRNKITLLKMKRRNKIMCKIINCLMPRVYLDADDVLYKTNETALAVINAKNGTAFTVYDINSWGVTGSLIDERLNLFSIPEFIKNLPLRDGAQDFVMRLQKIAEVFVCTSVELQCISARAEALCRDFPTVHPSHFVFTSRKDVVDGDILLDDGAHNILASNVKYPVLFREPWNNNITGRMAVNNYDDFLHFVYQLSERPQPVDLSEGGCICLVGPTCTKKAKIARALCKDTNFVRPQTYTTSDFKKDGYKSVTKEKFIELDETGCFIEKTVYGGSLYATPIKDIDELIFNHKISVLPIDICGAISLRNRYGSKKCLLVFCSRNKEDILLDLLRQNNTSNEIKVNLIMSIDAEMHNRDLCNIEINSNNDIESVVIDIKRYLKESSS